MPFLKIQTNQTLDERLQSELLSEASQLVAQELEKPESYVMVAIEPPVPMSFAGNTDPTAYLELKSIGLPESKSADCSRALASLLHAELDLPADRIYIEFTDAPRTMWGWTGGTF